jgi:hypothetical protein
VPHPQNTICATCPRNAWGSAPNGGKGKACGDHRRLAVVPLTDLRNESLGGPLLLRCPAASLQDLAAFDSRYKGLGYPYFTMGIKIGFDPVESFPKFTWAAIRPLTDAEGAIVMELRNSPETARVLGEAGPVAAPAQIAAAPQGAFLEPLPAGTPTAAAAQPLAAPQQVQVQPAPQPAVAQPAPAAAQPQPVVAPAVHPQPVAASAAGGFGPTTTAAPVGNGAAQQPAAVAAQPAQRPATAMTGFGAAAPEAAPQQAAPAVAAPITVQPEATPAPAVAQPTPAATPQTAPGVVSAFEGSIDERLNKLLG